MCIDFHFPIGDEVWSVADSLPPEGNHPEYLHCQISGPDPNREMKERRYFQLVLNCGFWLFFFIVDG